VIGLIALDGRQENQFSEHHVALAVTFANQVAIALENASLFFNLQTELEHRKDLIAELKSKNAEAETLRESAAIVVATLEKDEAIERILVQLERVVPYDSASVQLLNNNVLEIVSMRGFAINSMDQSEYRFELTEQDPAYPLLCGDAPYILIDDIQLSVAAFTEPAHNRIHSWLAVPLHAKGKKIGIIALDGYQVGQFQERHAQLAVTYANQVAIALENARLFSDLQTELGTERISSPNWKARTPSSRGSHIRSLTTSNHRCSRSVGFWAIWNRTPSPEIRNDCMRMFSVSSKQPTRCSGC
jgi:GAF domain-containing protein